MDTGNEPIADSAERDRVRTQARAVHIQSALLALGVTIVVIAL
jgi:hypothetical protein